VAARPLPRSVAHFTTPATLTSHMAATFSSRRAEITAPTRSREPRVAPSDAGLCYPASIVSRSCPSVGVPDDSVPMNQTLAATRNLRSRKILCQE